MTALIFSLILVGIFIFFKQLARGKVGLSSLESKEKLAKYGVGIKREGRKFLKVSKPDVVLSEESEKILEIMNSTSQNLFITGKAGTGKSTLLKYFRAVTHKNVAVVAPTGVAALNVEGQTIHKFFKFKPGVTFDSVRKRFEKEAIIYKKIDTLIIDEISMVRADLFDCMDKFLRLNGPNPNLPFGGIQIIAFGDLYQLPPVVKEDEKHIFQNYYRGEYFFHSHAFTQGKFLVKQLSHVYRQSDPTFVEILDAIRVNQVNESHLEIINSRVNYEETALGSMQITLVPTNALADSINLEHLNALPGQIKEYLGFAQGDFDERNFPTSSKLLLKEGTQIMLLNNEPKGKWVNGTLAKIIGLGNPGVRVMFEDGTYDDVIPYTWEMIRFIYDPEDKKIKSEVVGSFTQLPLRLAWAVTMHKAQGKTYNNITIDFGSGTFAPGQAYVALSRCRSLEGLVLKSPLFKEYIFTDLKVQEFMAQYSK